MAHRSVIEETFRTIAPSRYRGIPNPPPIAAGFDASGGQDLNTALSQAAQEISQLRTAWQQQATLIAANTNAVQSNGGGQSGGSTASNVVSSIFGGALGVISPVAKGILGLFGLGGSSAPAPLPAYVPPPPVSISGIVRSTSGDGRTAAPAGSTATPVSQSANVSRSANVSQAAAPSQVTVNINAMDSQSFLDRSNDIASAVRLAMLNLHPINDVVADL
jgi:hypothetical protein